MQSKFKIGQTVFWTKNKRWYVVEANISPVFVALEGYPNPVPVAQIKTEEELNETKEWANDGYDFRIGTAILLAGMIAHYGLRIAKENLDGIVGIAKSIGEL
jgi:hypothetical protein